MRGLLLTSITALAGCYSPHYEDCAISCAASHTCPSGLECDPALGMCRAPGGSCSGTRGDASDAASSADAAYPVGQWDTPTMVELGLNGVSDASLTPDMLALYFKYQSDIYVTTRPSTAEAWTPATLVTAVSGPAGELEQTPFISFDGLSLMFSSDRVPSMAQDMWITTRATRTSSWGAPTMVTELNSPADESGAYTPDGLTLVMGSTRGADGMLDVYIATRSIPTGTWSQPAPITELNQSTFGDSHPIISPDLKTIYFQSNRNGTVDLFTAHRAAAVGMFDSPVPIAEIDDPQAVDGDPWVSPDGHHMFFSHTVNGVSAIYETKR